MIHKESSVQPDYARMPFSEFRSSTLHTRDSRRPQDNRLLRSSTLVVGDLYQRENRPQGASIVLNKKSYVIRDSQGGTVRNSSIN